MGHIKFIVDCSTVEAEPQHFEAGRVYELPDASCDRWVRRQAAVQATADEFTAQTQAQAAAAPKKGSKKAAAVQASGPAADAGAIT